MTCAGLRNAFLGCSPDFPPSLLVGVGISRSGFSLTQKNVCVSIYDGAHLYWGSRIISEEADAYGPGYKPSDVLEGGGLLSLSAKKRAGRR